MALCKNIKSHHRMKRYNAINAMLLDEFLKEHHKNEEQKATITQLKSMMAHTSRWWETR